MISDTLDLISVKTPAWMRKAQCADTDPELFFSHPGQDGEAERASEALNVCKRCPVRVECLIWAFAQQDQWAILGAKTPKERVAILKGKTERLRHLRSEIMIRLRVQYG